MEFQSLDPALSAPLLAQLPVDGSFFELPSRKKDLQHQLFDAQQRLTVDQLLASLSPLSPLRAALLSTTSNHSGAWLAAAPVIGFLRMEDSVLRDNLCLRMLLPLPGLGFWEVPVGCTFCGASMYTSDGSHAFSCKGSRHGASTRHLLW